MKLLERAANLENWPLFVWTIADGLKRVPRTDVMTQTYEFQDALRHIDKTPQNGVYTMLDAQPYFEDPVNVRLIKELRESRRRIVAAQDERANKLERDIHDGAQQQLVALAVKERLAESLVGKDDERARSMLRELRTETESALQNLRDLARGIYPPLLADKGLTAALGSQVRTSVVPVTVEADEVGRYAREVEAAVYFSVLEALQNVAKYSVAEHAIVSLRQSDGVLSFEVSDDGRGFDPATVARGSGLRGVADRIEAVGGELLIESTLGNGTRITGHVPVGEAPGVGTR